MRTIDTPDGKFHTNIPGTPKPATQPKDWWINDIQKEMGNVIKKLGKLELNENDNTQFARAVGSFLNESMPVHVIRIAGSTLTPTETGINLQKDGGYFYIFSGVIDVQRPSWSPPIPCRLIAYRLPESTSWKATFQPFTQGQTLPIKLFVSDSGDILFKTTSGWPEGAPGRVHLILNKREKI